MLPNIMWNTPGEVEEATLLVNISTKMVYHMVYPHQSKRTTTLQFQCVNTWCNEGSGAGGETRTPNRPITNRVLYQLSHASNNRLFTRDFCVVNSCNVKKCLLAKSVPFHGRLLA